MVKICKHCRYGDQIDDAVRCRRYAPRPGQGRNGWSIVWEEDWCGEFEPERMRPNDEPVA